MEQETQNNKSESAAPKATYAQFLLPGSILIAAIMISGILLYTRSQSVNGTAQIGGNQPNQKAGAPIKIDVTGDDHVLGDSNAKVTIVEFADFRCPFCERLYKDVEPQLLKDYVDTGKARFVFKHFAFLGQQSTWAAEASECASEQGKFWDYHNWLYSNQAPETDATYYSKANLVKYAGKVGGIDISKFATCINSDKYAKHVADDVAQGQKDGVNGTPTIFINGQSIVGAQPYNVFQAMIDGLLKK